MKKILSATILAIMVMFVTGCKDTQPSEPVVSTDVTETTSENSENYEVKPVGNNPPADTEGFTPMGRYEFDVDGDGNQDTVTLYTSAQRDMKGDMMWDDSQTWVLQADCGENSVYDLYNNRIGGMVYMNVADYYNSGEEEKVITLIISSNTFHEIREYRYDDTLDGACFGETTVFTTDDIANEGIGNLYSSIPDYE